jgi:dihydrofolate reductase
MDRWAIPEAAIMRKIIIAEFMTLDGVIQAPGGEKEDTEGGFSHGGWTRPYWHDDIGKHFFDAMSGADTLLLGRKTWEIHGGAFDPMPDGDPFGDVMKAMKKYVVSTTLASADLWRNSTIISDDVVGSVQRLKQQDGKNILLDGSSVLAHTLIENDLVDEYMLHVYPLVLGEGKRLFPDGSDARLALIEASALPTGVVYMRYKRAE